MTILTTLTEAILPAWRYCAYVEGDEESGPHGFGATPVAAREDLQDLLDEKKEEEQQGVEEL